MDPYGNPFMPYAGPTGAQSMAIVPVGELLGCCRVWLHACCVCVVGCSKRKAGLVLFFYCFVVLAANACVASAGPLGMPVALVPYGMGPFGGQFLSYVCFFPTGNQGFAAWWGAHRVVPTLLHASSYSRLIAWQLVVLLAGSMGMNMALVPYGMGPSGVQLCSQNYCIES
jgi:hypothetical protein